MLATEDAPFRPRPWNTAYDEEPLPVVPSQEQDSCPKSRKQCSPAVRPSRIRLHRGRRWAADGLFEATSTALGRPTFARLSSSQSMKGKMERSSFRVAMGRARHGSGGEKHGGE
jgi:hypothetical protein